MLQKPKFKNKFSVRTVEGPLIILKIKDKNKPQIKKTKIIII